MWIKEKGGNWKGKSYHINLQEKILEVETILSINK